MSLKLNTITGKDYLTLDYEGFRQMMIDRLKERLPEYTDFSETDMGIVLIELTAHGLDILSYYKDRQALECFLPTARERKNVIMHCKTYFGYDLAGATPAIFIQVFETNKGGFSKKAGDVFRVHTKEKRGESSIYYELIGSLDTNDNFNPNFYIPEGSTGLETETKIINGKEVTTYVYRALVCQGITVNKENVGISDGTAYQKYTTSQSPALDYDSSVSGRFNEDVVKVFVGESSEEWTRVDNFLLSKPDSKHFTFSIDDNGNGVIEFGNDLSGKIPPNKSKIKCTYRVGGGEYTNVGANTITEYDTAESNLVSTFNPETALTLGTDAESIEEAKVKAPASLRALDRAVTIRDYADIGIQLDYVSSAQSVFVNNNNSFTDRNDKTIEGSGYEDIILGNAPYDHSTENGISKSNVGYVLTWLMTKNPEIDPDSYNYDDPKNIPHILISDDTLKFLRNDYYLNRKMIGQKFNVFPADIEWVVPHLRITVDDNYIQSSVIQDVKNKLIELMALGKYQLEQPVIWSDIVKELVDSSSGITGLRSAIFVDVKSDEYPTATTSRIIAEDKPSHVGRVYALKHSRDYTEEKPNYEFDIYAQGGLTGE